MQSPPENHSVFNADRYALRLAGPGGLEHFNRKLREREPVCFTRVFSTVEAADLCPVDLLAGLLLPGSTATASIDLYASEYLVRLSDMLHKSDRLAVDVVAEQLQHGATIRFRGLERCDPKLHGLAAAIAQRFQCATDINAYLTPFCSHGFSPHFDNTDVMVVQLLGAKRWCLYSDYSNRLELPLKDTPWNADKFRPGSAGQYRQLHPGDVLYIPRGAMHSATCENQMSLHLTFSLDTDPAVDQLARLLRSWAQQDVRARRRLPDEQDTARAALLQLTEDFHHWLQINAAPLTSAANATAPASGDDQMLRERFGKAVESISGAPRKP